MTFLGRLLCALGRHRPLPDSRWNGGYGFTRCERCGCDLVRSLLDDWQVPRGFRVAWHDVESSPTDQLEPVALPEEAEVTPRQVEPMASPVDFEEAEPVIDPVAVSRAEPVVDPFDFSEFDDIDTAVSDRSDPPDRLGKAGGKAARRAEARRSRSTKH